MGTGLIEFGPSQAPVGHSGYYCTFLSRLCTKVLQYEDNTCIRTLECRGCRQGFSLTTVGVYPAICGFWASE